MSYQADHGKFVEVDVMSQEVDPALRASIISRRSNTDMKGEHLVRIEHRIEIPEQKKEKTPLNTETEKELIPQETSSFLVGDLLDSKRFVDDKNAVSDKHADDYQPEASF